MFPTKPNKILATLLAFGIMTMPLAGAALGFDTLTDDDWDEAAVRKVLHVFAYGGAAADQQIQAWSEMAPVDAITEMLSFAATNPLLSPVEDNTVSYAGSLAALQALWSSPGPDNPTCLDDIPAFNETRTRADGNVVLRNLGLQNTWIAAVRARGLNPFRHRVGFWLVNYQMAVNLHDTEPPLIRDLYDRALAALEQEAPYHNVLAIGATSAAVAREYGHRSNIYNNNTGLFRGNDDFAREFHQLFFLINGVTEDPDYHENTTIEHTAWVLTGMQIDKVPDAYGTTLASEWWVAPIDFSDHFDASGRNIRNISRHYQGSLEILHQAIVGASAEEKLFALAAVAGQHAESLNNLPVSIINFFADDNLSDAKVAAIRQGWAQVAGQPGDLLNFLHAYAISYTFHRSDTFKYRTAFDRNMTLYNLNTVDNEEHYGNSFSPRSTMSLQGADVFVPVHDVFGGQTSLNAANNPNLFKEAYNNSVNYPNRIAKFSEACQDGGGNTVATWRKDWARLIPPTAGTSYQAGDVGEWLWRRFVGDGGSNYGPLERAHVTAILATGFDLGYLVDPDNPDISYSLEDMSAEPLASLIAANSGALMELASPVLAARRNANVRVGRAINFISMTPFMFVVGDLDAVPRRRDYILWRNRVTGQNWLYLMDGTAIAGSVSISAVPPPWQIVGNSDYNGDGMPDMLWRDGGSGRVDHWEMNDADITASSIVAGVGDFDWQVIGNGDYTGDGNADVLWRNSVTGRVDLWEMSGPVIASATLVAGVADLDWQVVGSGDYTGDGNADVLWRNRVTGRVDLWEMDGATIASSGVVAGVADLDWQVIGNGDYTGDGNADVLWRNTVTGRVDLWEMSGASIISSGIVAGVADLDWRVVGEGDYDGDGKSDVLWRHGVSGQTWMYLMNGKNIKTSAAVNTVADLNWEIIQRD